MLKHLKQKPEDETWVEEDADLEDALDEEEAEEGWLDGDSQAVLTSLLLHGVLLLALAIFPVVVAVPEGLSFTSAVPQQEEEFTLIEDVSFSDDFEEEIGANSTADSVQALSMALEVAEMQELASPSMDPPDIDATFELNNRIEQAVALTKGLEVVKGMTGVGTTGTDGAVDRITYEILRSMEERPTLVVWFFDQSGSLQKRRQEIRDRFDRIYEELGIVQKSNEQTNPRKKDEDEPLLTSIFAFGSQVNLLTPKPTADIETIRSAIEDINLDSTGTERTFSAIFKGVEKFKRYRSSKTHSGPARNVLFIAVTDERGDDDNGLEATIAECRKFAIPVYVIGVPAPFGREFTYVKYVDPDPNFDQTPQWAQVDQGPESIMPERIKLGFRDDYFSEPFIDSGFGPFALSRLAYETGGIYFTVHPNRQLGRRVRRRDIEAFSSNLEYFFDPDQMTKYRPDYVSRTEYMKRVSESPLRQIVVRAASMPRIDTLQRPNTTFIKRDEATLANELTIAQRDAARVEPSLVQLAEVLKAGQKHRETELSPRWIATYDLALGTVLAHKVRAESYNAMLAKAKRGMNFENQDNNTWVLEPSEEISIGSRAEKEGKLASDLLKAVVEKHKGTPWALLASRELERPVGWKWQETFTDLNPPQRNRGNNNNNNNVPRPGRDDEARMLAKPPPKRPIPKL